MQRASRLLLASLVLAAAVVAPARSRADALDVVRYQLRMPQPASHLFEVAVTAKTDGGEPLDFQMPAWSPGRYIVFDFARNVQDVAASDASGGAVDVAKVDKQTWRVTPRGPGEVVFAYRVYADNLSGTFSQLDGRHANYNGASLFVYVVGRKPAPVHLTVEPPKGWQVANGSAESLDQTEFDFANYDLLIDTPTEIAPDFDVRTFVEGGCEYRVVTHQLDGRTSPNRYAADVQRIVQAENAVMGVPPDLKRYTFLVHFAPRNDGGDGMEHLTSTQIVNTFDLDYDKAYDDALSVTAHEFFHVWNVKRLRPAELGPWDYTRENYTTSLWIAEGLTSYYGDLSLTRAGLNTEEAYREELAEQIATLENSPGRSVMSVERSSFDTWLFLGARSRQRTNQPRTTISYYNKGEVLGALLDLEIRRRTNNARSLDDVFRLLWKRFYLDAPAESYYYKGRGYRGADFRAAVDEVSGADFGDFFARYVSGTQELDYDTPLGYVGLKLGRQRRVSASDYGVRLEEDDARLRVESLKPDGLGAQSGLRVGDVLVRIDDRVATKAVARDLFEKGRVTPTPVRVLRDGRDMDLLISEVPATLTFELEERGDATPAQRAARRSWLSGGSAVGAR
jgi:predicted metalloprotease with PDZ domain